MVFILKRLQMCKTYVFWTFCTIIATGILLVVQKVLSLLMRSINGKPQVSVVTKKLNIGEYFWSDNDLKNNCNISQSMYTENSLEIECTSALCELHDKADDFRKNLDSDSLNNGCYSGQQFKSFTSSTDGPLEKKYSNKPTKIMSLCKEISLQHNSHDVSNQKNVCTKSAKVLLQSKARPSKIPIKSHHLYSVNNKNIKKPDDCVSSSMAPNIKSYFSVYEKQSYLTDRKDSSPVYSTYDPVYNNLNGKTKTKEVDLNLSDFILCSKLLKCEEIVNANKQTLQNSLIPKVKSSASKPQANSKYLSPLNLNALNSPKNLTACEKAAVKKEKSPSPNNKASIGTSRGIQHGRDSNKDALKPQIKSFHSVSIKNSITFEDNKLPKLGKTDCTGNGSSQQISKFKPSGLITVRNKASTTKNTDSSKEVTLENQYPVFPPFSMRVISNCKTEQDLYSVIPNENHFNKNCASQTGKHLETCACVMCDSDGFAIVNVNTGRRVADHRFRTEFEVFFRAGVLPHLEAQRDEKLTDRVIKFQACCRGYLSRKRFAKLKVEQLAVRCIQRNVRKFLSVRDWPWWRLLVRVTPLLNVHRTEEDLRAKTEELETLRNKYEKLEQERTQLKHENGKLEAKLSEITVDLAEEHSTATLASERLELETAERVRLEKELQDVQAEKKQLQENAERLEFELLCAHTGVHDENGVGESDDGEDGEGGGAYKQRYERAVRELEFTRRRLQQQHQDDLEQLIGLKKQLEKKLSDAYEEVEEQRQVVSQWKRKVQKLNSETNDLRLLLEEQNSRNNLLEKKQRKFDAEFQLLTDELRQERANKERAMRERELALGDKYTMEQNLSAVKLELELKEQKVAALSKELDELTFGGNTEEDVALLKKAKHQLESKLKDQEEELDDLAGQVQLLEQAKLRLEMSIEQMRKENRRELSQRDEELEEVRCNAQKKVKALECQLESEHEERTLLLRERHEMERRLAEYEERIRASRTTDQETLQKLRRDLKRTKALLRDAQATIHQSKVDTPNKAVIRQLRNQLEDAECARVAAVKARQVVEAEAAETTAALEEAVRARSEAEERMAGLTRECSQLQSQLDENEEELAEVLKKYRAAVTQLSTEQMSLQEQASRVAELETERASLKEQLAELSSRLENIEIHGDPTSSLTVKRLQLKTKELESKLELEQTTRSRMEVQIARLKETTERLQSECETLRAKEYSAQENARRSARTVREMREEMANLASKEQEGQVQRRDLEKRLEAAEAEANAARSDLRLALQRIEDLQCVIQGELEEGDEANEGASDSDGDSVTSEDSMDTFLANHTLHTASAASLSRGSIDSFRSAERSSSERLQVKKLNDTVTKDSSYA